MIHETEYISSSAYYGHGIVFCKDCHKDGVTLLDQGGGNYDQDALPPPEVALLYEKAHKHDNQFPDHNIRVIVFSRTGA